MLVSSIGKFVMIKKCIVRWNNIRQYWVGEKIIGKGLIIWSCGNKYDGEFYKNCLHDKCTKTWKDGHIYIGNWKKKIT